MKKDTASTLIFNPTAITHFYSFFLMAATFSCEVIIAVSILISAVTSMHKFALLILMSRLLAQIFPTVFVIHDLLRKESTLKPLLDSVNVFKASSTYGPLIFLSFFDCSMLTFLPWNISEISELSRGYPTVQIFRMCLFFKMTKLVLTFCGQTGNLLEIGVTGNTFSIFVLVNVGLSTLELTIAILSAILQWGILTGTSKLPLDEQNPMDVEVLKLPTTDCIAICKE